MCDASAQENIQRRVKTGRAEHPLEVEAPPVKKRWLSDVEVCLPSAASTKVFLFSLLADASVRASGPG